MSDNDEEKLKNLKIRKPKESTSELSRNERLSKEDLYNKILEQTSNADDNVKIVNNRSRVKGFAQPSTQNTRNRQPFENITNTRNQRATPNITPQMQKAYDNFINQFLTKNPTSSLQGFNFNNFNPFNYISQNGQVLNSFNQAQENFNPGQINQQQNMMPNVNPDEFNKFMAQMNNQFNFTDQIKNLNEQNNLPKQDNLQNNDEQVAQHNVEDRNIKLPPKKPPLKKDLNNIPPQAEQKVSTQTGAEQKEKLLQESEDLFKDFAIPEGVDVPEAVEIPEEIEVPESVEPNAIPNKDVTIESPNVNELYGKNEQQETKENDVMSNFGNYIPENKQSDILALVDVSLYDNISAALIAAAEAGGGAVASGGSVGSLVGTTLFRNKKIWLVVLLILLLLGGMLGIFYDKLFGTKIYEEEATGLEIVVSPSNGLAPEDENAEYVYLPGDDILFTKNTSIGADKYRYYTADDGTLKSEPNEAFTFLFRFYIEFIDEPYSDTTTGYNAHKHLIEEVYIPDSTKNNVAWDDNTEYYYYKGLVYPGEVFVPFANGIKLSAEKISNAYQGRKFKICLEYYTIVPSSYDKLYEDPVTMNAPQSWIELVVDEFEIYLQNGKLS